MPTQVGSSQQNVEQPGPRQAVQVLCLLAEVSDLPRALSQEVSHGFRGRLVVALFFDKARVFVDLLVASGDEMLRAKGERVQPSGRQPFATRNVATLGFCHRSQSDEQCLGRFNQDLSRCSTVPGYEYATSSWRAGRACGFIRTRAPLRFKCGT